jgi:hypothetical protein
MGFLSTRCWFSGTLRQALGVVGMTTDATRVGWRLSDQELDTYQKLLLELRELLPAEEPKALPAGGGDERPCPRSALSAPSAELYAG